MSDRLSSQQRQFFKDEGYLIVPDVFAPADLEPLRKEIEQRVDTKINALHAEGKVKNLHADQDFDHRLAKIYHDEKANGEAIVKDLQGPGGGGHRGVEMFGMIRHPKLLAVVESLLESPEIVASSVYRLRPKIPNFGLGVVPWHQDSGYLVEHCDQHLILTVWVPLVDANVHNGCMEILPRAHRKGIVTHHTGGKTFYLVVEENDLPADAKTAIPAECPRGGAIFMTNLTPHCSTPNFSDIVRWSIDLRYQSADVPNNVDLWPEVDADATPEVLMACYPPEADFIVQSRKNPELVSSYDDYVNRRSHYESIKKYLHPGRGWKPLARPVEA